MPAMVNIWLYDELYYSNDIRELNEGGEGIEKGIREIPESMELYHKIEKKFFL